MTDAEKAKLKESLKASGDRLQEAEKTLIQAKAAGIDVTFQEQRIIQLRDQFNRLMRVYGV